MVYILENGEDRLLVLKPKELWECPGCVGSRRISYPPVFYPGVYTHLSGGGETPLPPPPSFAIEHLFSIFLKIQKLTFLMVLWWCFHENCQFFDVCEIAVTGGSLVLFFPHKNWNWGLFDSEIFKELEVLAT
jgi:hypothetical protein